MLATGSADLYINQGGTDVFGITHNTYSRFLSDADSVHLYAGNTVEKLRTVDGSPSLLYENWNCTGDFTATGAAAFKHGEATQGYTVATLPTPTVGMIARVTDANSPSIGSTVTGSGAAAALVWYNGSNWTVIGV